MASDLGLMESLCEGSIEPQGSISHAVSFNSIYSNLPLLNSFVLPFISVLTGLHGAGLSWELLSSGLVAETYNISVLITNSRVSIFTQNKIMER